MRKIFLTIVLGILTLCCTSCSKDIELAGTTWTADCHTEVMGMQLDAVYMMKFLDSESGIATFDGTDGVMYFSEGQAQPFTYDKKEKTLTWTTFTVNGKESLAFTQVK